MAELAYPSLRSIPQRPPLRILLPPECAGRFLSAPEMGAPPLVLPDRGSDMLITLGAECTFDAEPELSRVQAAALVLGGTNGRFYTEDLFRRTAAGMPNGRAVILPGKSHGYVAGSKETAKIALDFLRA